MDILDKIVKVKREEVKSRKRLYPINKLEESILFNRIMPSFFDALNMPGPSIIGEFKRKSPSKGIINNTANIEEVANGYNDSGIAAMSILTDKEFFGGDELDLRKVAGFSSIPIIRKDFIIDEYQIIESKSIGAAAILLIASILTKGEIENFLTLATTLGLDVLFEVHDEKDIDKMNNKVKIAGVNNRNLKTFEINTRNSIGLLHLLPKNCIKVAESGFQTPDDVAELYAHGYDAFLIGEKFMRSEDPAKTAAEFIINLKIPE